MMALNIHAYSIPCTTGSPNWCELAKASSLWSGLLSCVRSAKVATSADVNMRVARAMSPTLSSDEEDDEQHRAPAVANRLKPRRTLNAEAIVKNTRGAHSHTTPRASTAVNLL